MPAPERVLSADGDRSPTRDRVPPAGDEVRPGRVAAAALRGAGSRRAVFSRADVAGQVAALLPTTGLGAAEVVDRVEQLTDLALNRDEAVTIGRQSAAVTPRASDARYATVQVLTAEARILDLAAHGRKSGYGQVLHSSLMPMGRDGRLDPSQYRAVLQLAAGGDFLSVLTAPAGAGKTSTLITAAARVGAKVVLVGDPAQIGVVNGPGGMFAALAHAGHGIELAEIHRFSQPWERQASLALRQGEADALGDYRLAGRLHPCIDGDTALDGVFGH